MRLLTTAGARASESVARADVASALAALADAAVGCEPMFSVRDARETVAWYQAIGFGVVDAYEEDGKLRFARLTYGACRFAISPNGQSPANVSVWVRTSRWPTSTCW